MKDTEQLTGTDFKDLSVKTVKDLTDIISGVEKGTGKTVEEITIEAITGKITYFCFDTIRKN